MNWNKDMIINLGENLLKELEKNPNDNINKLDYNSFICLLQTYDDNLYNYYNNKLPQFNLKIKEISTNQKLFLLDSENNIKKIESKIINTISLLDRTKIQYNLLFYKTKTNYNKQLILLEDFCKSYDINLYNLYKELNNNGYIQSTKRYFQTLGTCFYFNLTNQTFLTYTNNNYTDISVLIHELGHASQLDNFKSNNLKTNYMISSYREAYSIFLGLIFNDYCINNICNNKIKKEFSNLTAFELENIKAYIDYYYSKQNQNNSNKKNMDIIVSDVIAIYMYSLYNNDKTEFEKFNNFFQNTICNKLDSELTNELPLDKINNACTNVIKEYNVKLRKRVK